MTTSNQGTPSVPARLTADELAELRTLGAGGPETALEWRAAALAAHPFLLAEVEHSRAERDRVRAEAFEEAARCASDFSMKPDRSLHPDVPWDRMNATTQVAAHSTAQSIAMDIRALALAPPRERPDPIPVCGKCGRTGKLVPDCIRNETRLAGHRWWCAACGYPIGCFYFDTRERPEGERNQKLSKEISRPGTPTDPARESET